MLSILFNVKSFFQQPLSCERLLKKTKKADNTINYIISLFIFYLNLITACNFQVKVTQPPRNLPQLLLRPRQQQAISANPLVWE